MEGLVKAMVRPLQAEDSADLWRIRNSESVRAVSHHHDKIPWEQHQQWFEKYRRTPGNQCYIVEVVGKVAGYCRIDQGLVSIAVDPTYHGQGLGKRLLKEAVDLASANGQIKAEIRKDNPASLRLFEAIGFRVIEETPEYWKLEYGHSNRN